MRYGPAQAVADYKDRMATLQVWRAQKRAHGPDWRCGHCGLAFPAAAYGVERHDSAELHQLCVGPGHYRCCTACAKLRDAPTVASEHRRCEKCRQHRSPPYFLEDVAVCCACVLHATYQWAACGRCAKPHAVRELRAGEGQLVCYSCSPAHWPYECTSCKDWNASGKAPSANTVNALATL